METNHPQFGPTSILDIVSFSFRQTVNQIIPFTKLSLAFVLFAGLTIGFLYPDFLKLRLAMHHHNFAGVNWFQIILMALLFMGVGLLFYYLIYVFAKYIQDLYNDSLSPDIYSYYALDERLWGLIGVGLIYLLGLIIGGVAIALGFVALILPGLILMGVFAFLNVRFSLVWVTYFLHPENGIWGAFGNSWRLTSGNVWRAMGLWTLMLTILYIVNAPLGIASGALGFMYGFSKPFAASALCTVLFMAVYTGIYWFKVISISATVFGWFRFYFDLEARQNQLQELPETFGFSSLED